MAAEIYHCDLVDDRLEDSRDHVLGDDDGAYRKVGYGDGSGHETCVVIRNNKVLIFSGKAVLQPPRDEEDEAKPKIEVVEHLATLQVGEPRIVPLIGPENNNKALLFVRNIGDPADQPLAN